MDIEQIKELMKALSESSFSKLTFKKGDVELSLEKESFPLRPHPRAMDESSFPSELPLKGARGGSTREEAAPAPAEAPAGLFVKSPMVGTFYASASPDQPPFVKVGDRVDRNSVVCIVEAMKVMNEVKAGESGTIVELLAQNGHPVEFGTKLFRIQP